MTVIFGLVTPSGTIEWEFVRADHSCAQTAEQKTAYTDQKMQLGGLDQPDQKVTGKLGLLAWGHEQHLLPLAAPVQRF